MSRARLKEQDPLGAFLKSPLWILTAVLLTLQAGTAIYRVVQRGVWLFTEFKPLNIAYEKAFMACYEGLVLCHMLLVLFTGITVLCFVIRKSHGNAHRLRRMLKVRRVMCHVAAWLCVVAAAGIEFLCVHYRLTVTVLGVVGIAGAALFVLYMFKARYFRSCSRLMS